MDYTADAIFIRAIRLIRLPRKETRLYRGQKNNKKPLCNSL